MSLECGEANDLSIFPRFLGETIKRVQFASFKQKIQIVQLYNKEPRFHLPPTEKQPPPLTFLSCRPNHGTIRTCFQYWLASENL